ncbi:hypothetical protein J4E86_000547 [Alternaria arbusti]|uniref:uncharacterized protein n=1 Tax=Alternaria arbusti TaxID=232088 RepID=UPI00221F28C9|nr:uncharacterized protein J4E86_000547 [Alternaria arbusti]KAI4961519.1 hypothetical protein J4E86_000547 [Alternaria arbusti]
MRDKYETPEVGTIRKDALTYQEAIEKGQRLLALTIADITDGPPQSQFQDVGDLEMWGWCTFTLASPNPTPATNLVRALGPTLKSSPTTAGILTNHDDTVTIDGKTYPATMAHIHSVIEPEAGILLAECNTTPEAMLNPCRNLDPATLVPKLPELRHWSDVAFLQWKDSEEAMALCGTPNGSGVLHLLAQHKAKLGYKTIQEVCLCYEDEDEDEKGLREVPTLIFHVEDV